MLNHALPVTRLLLAAAVCASALPAVAQTDTFKVAATVRDFKSGANPGGHPDFDTSNEQGRSDLTYGIVAPKLGVDGLPVYNTIRPANNLGNDPLTTKENFDEWYRDAPSSNKTLSVDLTFGEKPGDPGVMTTAGYNANLYMDGRFLPISGEGWGNEAVHANGANNWNFTTQFVSDFLYRPATTFKFVGDDDVWVYVNDDLVIDLGGTHNAKSAWFLMLDGKVFINADAFPAGGDVQTLDHTYLSTLETYWSDLGMSERLPLRAANHTFIDLNLGVGRDVRAIFNVDSVTIFTTGDPPVSVRLDYEDDTSDFRTGRGNGARYGSSRGKSLRGAWVNGADGRQQYVTAGGMQAGACQLSFFHAERHYSGSAFQIETTVLGDGRGGDYDYTGFD